MKHEVLENALQASLLELPNIVKDTRKSARALWCFS